MLSAVRVPVSRVVEPIARAVARTGLGPNSITVIGTVGVATAALICYPTGRFVVGSIVILAFAVFDMLDGAVARLTGRTSEFGALLDSSLDRVSDGALLGAVAIFYARGGHTALAAIAVLALVGALVTSYVRARAESLGLDASVGLIERSERVLLLVLAALIAGLISRTWPLSVAVSLLAVGGALTVVQRLVAVRRQVLAREQL